MNATTLHQAIDHVLLKEWDPIGVSDAAAAQDEYSLYVAGLANLLRRGASESEIASALTAIERDRMGLTPDHARATRVAALLLSLEPAG